MQLPKLTPLQSRLLASAIATCLVLTLWITVQPHHFVYAAELPLAFEDAEHSQHGQAIPLDGHILHVEDEQSEEREGEANAGYVGEFAYFDRSLIGRADDGVGTLENNVKQDGSVNPGSTSNFVFQNSKTRVKSRGDKTDSAKMLDERGAENGSRELEHLEEEAEEDGNSDLKRRQSGGMVYISVNTCRQPTPSAAFITSPPPQLTLYVSTSTQNQKPGPNAKDDLATDPIPFESGYANFSVSGDLDVYIGVSAPSLSQGWVGNFSFEVAASTDALYHVYDEDTFLYMIDTDSESALFITHSLTTNDTNNATNHKWLDLKDMPFTMYAFNESAWGATGLERSYCGLKQAFSNTTINNITVDSSLTNRYSQRLPKGLFHVQSLDRNQTYVGFLAMEGNVPLDGRNVTGDLSIGNGSKVWKQFNWTTKNSDSCQVIFNMSFCSNIAYAVPSSPQFKTNTTGLASLYDEQAAAYYQNFSNSLAQVACDTTGTAQYSLARTCEDCAHDYKAWLCSVLMPRCDDFSVADHWLQERNINALLPDGTLPYSSNMSQVFNETKRNRFAYSKSRNPMIDEVIKPGPYKELLPCEDLCFDIVRSCPAQLSFSCPNQPARALTYGKRSTDPSHPLQCNFPGAVVDLNTFKGSATGLASSKLGIVVAIAVAVAMGVWI